MIAIKGMELPKSCKECDLKCQNFTHMEFQERAKYRDTRMPTCTLTELPEEPEPLKFEVNRAYKTRDDSKVFLFKIKTFGAYEYYFIGDYGVKFWVDIEGKFKENQESPFDIVGYWEEEK